MRKTLLMTFALLSMAPAVHADVLDMPAEPPAAAPEAAPAPAAPAPAAPAVLPQRGASMNTVVQQYGEPKSKHPPAGGDSRRHPPITRWDYADFAVFFEREKVVDAVRPGAPPPLHNVEQLKK